MPELTQRRIHVLSSHIVDRYNDCEFASDPYLLKVRDERRRMGELNKVGVSGVVGHSVTLPQGASATAHHAGYLARRVRKPQPQDKCMVAKVFITAMRLLRVSGAFMLKEATIKLAK